MTARPTLPARRRALHQGLRQGLRLGLGLTAAGLGSPLLASSRRTLPAMTEGPFYPPRAWRDTWPDWDADLTRVQGRAGGPRSARGQHLGLVLQVADVNGRAVDGAEVEIWQCDAGAQYRHPSVHRNLDTPGDFDPGFQGFGSARSDAAGGLRFRTIRPVPYPGRTPHIHVLLRHASFGTLVSQLFVAGEAGNARDMLWRSLDEDERGALAMSLQAAPAGSGLVWAVQHRLVVPA